MKEPITIKSIYQNIGTVSKKHGKIYIEFWDEETGETCEIQTHCINQEEAKQILEKEGKDYIPPRLFLNEKIRLRKFMRKEGRTWAS